MPSWTPSRRTTLLAGLSLTLPATPTRTSLGSTSSRFLPDRFRPYWQAFRARFLSSDGRIVDTGNGGRSHSEGQGWGLLFATEARDRESFDRILSFTENRLRRPEDGLLRWLWLPGAADPTPDPNNATDGDVYVCWALFRAADLWNEPDFRVRALSLLRAIETNLARRHRHWTFLLPGIHGFEHDTHWTLNPSYGVVPAWRIFAGHGTPDLWRAIIVSHLEMSERARFGRFRLPPDWLRLEREEDDFRLSIAPEWPPRFSYDAVRTPLLLAWGGYHGHPAAVAAAEFWRSEPTTRAWLDLTTGAVSPYAAAPGVLAIAALLRSLAEPHSGPSLSIPVDPGDDYYSSALRLLCVMAANHLQIGLRN
jgi:endoglucanase